MPDGFDADAYDDEDDEAAGRRRARQVAVVAAGCLVAVGSAIFGWAGLLGALSLIAVAGTVAALSRVPAAPTPHPPTRPGGRSLFHADRDSTRGSRASPPPPDRASASATAPAFLPTVQW